MRTYSQLLNDLREAWKDSQGNNIHSIWKLQYDLFLQNYTFKWLTILQ